jgi:hypothetical protein
LSRSLHGIWDTEEADEVALDSEVFILLGIFEGDCYGAADIIVAVVGGELHAFLPVAHLVVALRFAGVELDVELHAASESSEEGGQFVLSGAYRTIGYY